MTEPTDNELIACFDMAFSEGLQEALANTTDERLKDLIERRLLVGYYNAISPSPTPQADSQPAPQQEPDEISSYIAARAWVARAAQESKK